MSTYKQHSNNFLKQFTIAVIIALGAIGMTNCSTDDNAIIDMPNESAAVMFNTSVEKETQTRATSLDNDKLKTEGFGVLAYYTQNSAWTAAASTAAPNFMYNQKVTYGSTWNYSPVKYWPTAQNHKVSFFSYAPYESSPTDGANKGIKLSANTATGAPTIYFTVNSSIANQVDLVYASEKDINKELVDFQFKHALSRVGFTAKAAENYGATVIKVKSISIAGKFYPSGKLNLLNGEWSDMTATDVTYKKEGLDIALNNTTEQPLLGEGQYLMIIPKNFTGVNDKIKITVAYTSTTNGVVSDVISKEVFIDEKNFQQSEAYKIALNISLDQNITVVTESNSYIVAPNSAPLKIPVSRANKSMLGVQLNTGDIFTAQLLWTDNSNKISSSSNIKSIGVEGTGPTGFLIIEPGSAQGNAVVAIKNAAGKVLWSWHIWVTDYTPNVGTTTGDFMNRNLGAMNNFLNTPKTTDDFIKSRGLLYQWGRKDPFPGSILQHSNKDPILYNAGTVNPVVISRYMRIYGDYANNPTDAFANPLTFYFDDNGSKDWYSLNEQNNSLWGKADGTKSVYDPCPPGWRVPKKESLKILETKPFNVLKVNNSNGGRSYESFGGFYPLTGYRVNGYHSPNAGTTNENTFAGVWSSDVDGTNAFALNFDNGQNIALVKGFTRGTGLSVRCVKE